MRPVRTQVGRALLPVHNRTDGQECPSYTSTAHGMDGQECPSYKSERTVCVSYSRSNRAWKNRRYLGSKTIFSPRVACRWSNTAATVSAVTSM